MEKHLVCLKGLESMATAVKSYTEKGDIRRATEIDTYLKELMDCVHDNFDEAERPQCVMEEGPQLWFRREEYGNLAEWWTKGQEARLAGVDRDGKLDALQAEVGKVDEDKKSARGTLMDSDAVVDYLKYGTGPKVVQTLQLYEDDLQAWENVGWRILDELGRMMRWMECDITEEVPEEAEVRTLYPTPREWLIYDVLHAVREYRQALATYGDVAMDETAQEAMVAMLHRDDKREESKTFKNQKDTGEQWSCEECELTLLPPLPASPEAEVSFEEQQWIGDSKTLDPDFNRWSAHLFQELSVYRYHISNGKMLDENVLMNAGMIVTLAKGKFKERGDPPIDEQKHLPVPGSWIEEDHEDVRGDDSEYLDLETFPGEFGDERVEVLARSLRAFCASILRSFDRAGIDQYLLRAARKLVEQAGRGGGAGPGREEYTKILSRELLHTTPDMENTKTVALYTNIGADASEFAEHGSGLDDRLMAASHTLFDIVKVDTNAGWEPEYDVRVIEAAHDVLVLEKAIEHDSIPSLEPIRRISPRKTVRWAQNLVEILGKKNPKVKGM
ncbi:hypothetical protein MBM_02396 [Drepanopeziza brunnea f. sp. 'multigermtubi' MB_m1]|uniref:Uncharacterized protein n=1 Tax=Marssonina brunnea f. sp. multigermtubi (strain MB_m1) TaxID=1072389 RepID=K1Y226_MARBU|nr:uncharacterized protein MBM_02396 [Drepanopeziza brunnea f. sp. 'multigermtubi' MB_m1]EKD19159.1 hypothetical protein MBM_02396 [Drepanopeziza brunnea f. sp. 'multigermtubi' MB_m1]